VEREDRPAGGDAVIDHVAHPSFDVAATHRFYTDALGARLKSALTGDSPEWGARFLLAAYELEGAELDFFSFEGIVRPQPDGLPKDIRHVGIAVAEAGELARVRARLDEHAVTYWVERHDGDDDEHLYVRDPNDLVIEFSVAAAPHAERVDAEAVLRQWIETTPAS
jgi:catechol 2,3-dioxygenase-like lactoylglutathione lyase family enzyme